MTSAAQHTAAVQKSATPKPPIPLLVNPHKRHRAKTGRSEKGKWESLLEKKTGKGRGVKNETDRHIEWKGFFRGVVITSCMCSCVCRTECARSRESTCPDVSQLCSTTKQYLIQSNSKNLPAPPLPHSLPLSLVLSFHPHQKLPIARQRSVIKTHVYTRVSFMDQDLERGGKQTRERGVNHVEQRATVVCFLSPFLELNTVHIWRRPKTVNNAAIQHVIPVLRNRNSVI